MNLVKELEDVLKQSNFMGETDKVGVNLAVNAILDKIDELGFDVVERKKLQYLKDINGKEIKEGDIVTDPMRNKYKFQWMNTEWQAETVTEPKCSYPMYQERVLWNEFKVLE